MEFLNLISLDSLLLLGGFFVVCVSAYQISIFFKKYRLPLVSGLIIAGLFSGQYIFNLIPSISIDSLFFLNDFSLAFIAFAAGSELYLKEIKNRITSIKWYSLSNIFITFLVGFLLIFILLSIMPIFENISFTIKVSIALLTGTVFVARSPASATAVVNELKSKGPFTSTAMGIVCVSDFGVVILFSIIFSFVKSIDSGSFHILSLLYLIFELVFSFLLGIVLGRILNIFLSFSVNKFFKYFLLLLLGYSSFLISYEIRNLTILYFYHEFIIEPLLICMTASLYIINKTDKRLEFLNFIEKSSIYIYVVFFTLIGASINLPLLYNVFGYAIIFFILRLISLFIASNVGGFLAYDKSSFRLLGWMPHITQAGVAIGLIKIIETEFVSWGDGYSEELSIILISSIIISQFIGPPLFKLAITYIGEHNRKKLNVDVKKNDAIIFGLEPQSISIAKLLKSRGWDVDIVSFESKNLIKVPKEIGMLKINAIDKHNFDKINFNNYESVVCLSTDNINSDICKLSYSTYGNKNLIVRINDHVNVDIFLKLKVKIIHPSEAIVSLIDQFVRSPQATSIMFGLEKDKETRDITLLNNQISGLVLRDLRLPSDVLMLSIKRNDELIISHGYTRLLKDDIITFIGSSKSLDKLTLRFDS